MNTQHHQMMAYAIQLARRGRFSVSPNPVVGAVLVKAGKIIGEGWHQRAGEPHAEVYALNQAIDQGVVGVKDSVLYVTLEPCSHFGRTPPCVDTVIRAGIKQVVYGMQDPNPQVAGKGLALLQKAGIEVIGPIMEQEARELNLGYIKRHQTGLPRVTVKLAASLDGRTAMSSGESQWITGIPARQDVQRLRASSCAIVTSIETVLTDDPRLTVRPEDFGLANEGLRQPLRVILDSKGRLPATAKLLNTGGKLLQIVSEPTTKGLVDESEQLERIHLPSKSGIDLTALLQELANRHCNEVMVEAGAKLAGSFIQSGLVDELVIYLAPTLLGSSARPLINLPLDLMAQQCRLKLKDSRLVGEDMRLTLAISG